MYDVIVIGGGPAGLTSAIYLARAKYKVLVIEKENFGGQITITDEVVNYPGVFKTSGKALTSEMKKQGESFGAEYKKANVTKVDFDGDIKKITLESGEVLECLGVVLALGASPRKIGFKGENEYAGRGVAYCATCDGEFFTGKDVLVIGGGFAAVEEGMFLTKYARKVTLLVRRDKFSCAQSVVDKLADYPTINVLYNSEVIECGGVGVVTFANIKNNKTGEIKKYTSDSNIGIFVFAGYAPQTELVKDKVELNEQGYIVTDVDQKTNVLGVYAAGDVCIKNLRQVVTAVSDGAKSATSLEKHVSKMHEKLNLPAFVQEKKVVQQVKQEAPKPTNAKQGAFIPNEMRAQLATVFSRFEKVVTAVVVKGEKNFDELNSFANELNGISPKVKVAIKSGDGEFSYITIDGGKQNDIRFYSVPGGHEFNSFVIALYNVAGPGQATDDVTLSRIKKLSSHKVQVLATLSCTNCPEVVMGTQKIASLNSGITAEMYDLAKFPELKTKYNVMAVPCMIVDEKKLSFGKKTLADILTILENA